MIDATDSFMPRHVKDRVAILAASRWFTDLPREHRQQINDVILYAATGGWAVGRGEMRDAILGFLGAKEETNEQAE